MCVMCDVKIRGSFRLGDYWVLFTGCWGEYSVNPAHCVRVIWTPSTILSLVEQLSLLWVIFCGRVICEQLRFVSWRWAWMSKRKDRRVKAVYSWWRLIWRISLWRLILDLPEIFWNSVTVCCLIICGNLILWRALQVSTLVFHMDCQKNRLCCVMVPCTTILK